jgi:hypothetical protein
MTDKVRPEVVEELVHTLAASGPDAMATHVEALVRDKMPDGQVPSGVTAEEYRWALQRVRGMTDEERAAAAADPDTRTALHLVKDGDESRDRRDGSP